MSYSGPSLDSEFPAHIVEAFDKQSPEILRQIARYAEQLAEHRDREQRLAEFEETEDETMDRPDDLPEDVPSKATITVKEINAKEQRTDASIVRTDRNVAAGESA